MATWHSLTSSMNGRWQNSGDDVEKSALALLEIGENSEGYWERTARDIGLGNVSWSR